MFQKKTLIVGFIVVALGLAFGTFFIRSNHKQDTKKVKASSGTNTVTTQSDWSAGTSVNIDLNTSPGSVKINANIGTITVSGAGDASYNGVYDENGAMNGHPSYTNGSRWLFYWGEGNTWYLGVQVGGLWINGYWGAVGVNDLPANPWYMTLGGPGLPNPTVNMNALATHTTGANQIDGGANFWQWESSTPAQSTPANTSITYRYRTSTNGSDWTAWVANIGSVTSRTGDDSNNPTKYRYLQIEATLSNTDGTSTPTIDSYSIGYHTNQKPNAPSAMTAVIN